MDHRQAEVVAMRSSVRVRRAGANVAMWGGWAGSIGLGTWSIIAFNPERGDFAPQWVGLAFILLIGVAIAGSASAARYRMAQTIVDAFRAGLTGRNIDEDRGL